MSASQNKKKRQNEPQVDSRAAENAQQAIDSKKFRLKVIAVIALFIVAVIVVLVFNSKMFYNKTAAITINGTKYTAADYNFYYVSQYSEYYNYIVELVGEDYAYMYLPSTSTPFEEQIRDESTGETWADYFEEGTISRMTRITALCDEAEKAGVELTVDQLAAAQDQLLYMSYSAIYSGFSDVDTYLEQIYGEGMTEEIFSENYERTLLASSYAQSIMSSYEYTEDELDSRYAEYADDYDYISFYGMLIYAQIPEDDDSQEALDAAMEAAREDAELLASGIMDESTYTSQAMSYIMENPAYYDNTLAYNSYSVQGAELSDAYKDWLLDPGRVYGDVDVFAVGGDGASTVNGYYLIMYMDRDSNDYESVNGYYMLVPHPTLSEDDYESDEEYSAALADAEADAQAFANEIADAWRSGDYETPADLQTEYAQDLSGYGSYDQVSRSDVSDAIGTWLFDSAHAEGDCQVITSTANGYYVVIYLGQDELVSRLIAEDELVSEDFDIWEDSITADYTVSPKWSMRFTRKIASLGG